MNATDPVPAIRATCPAARRFLLSHDPRRGRSRGFALVVTLLIMSLLAVIAVSYLTSMSNERQTADAYTSKTRAEQAAQAGADAAMAILTQSFRDFPDSATVWDPKQSTNTGSPNSAEVGTTVNTPNNEGTSLYLRAVAQAQPVSINGKTATVADPFPPGSPLPPNATNGNNPNNPACKTFVLPLISGVPGGYAQVASEASGSSAGNPPLLPAFDLAETDPAKQTDSRKQYCTDLNVRRFHGDLQGVIGSPADWAAAKPLGPKPARALWVNVKESDPSVAANKARVTGRYAFWIEDESFRANISSLGALNSSGAINRSFGQTDRPDNTTTKINGTARALTLGDMSLPGFINALLNDPKPDVVAKAVLDTRTVYPGGVFPEPLAFVHGTAVDLKGAPSLSTTQIDALRYSSTTQSGALNFTRHGTQRLNLNDLSRPATGSTVTSQAAVDEIVETLKFHLPNFGQRFYRTSAPAATDSSTLNATQVSGSSASGNALIYLYKVAANLCDFLDADSQPTMILSGGNVDNNGKPAGPQESDTATAPSSNAYWAQGKETAPFIQEVAVRYRPIVNTVSHPPKGHFSLTVDYYVEVWNMSNRDIYATQQSDKTLPHLGGATLWVRNQQMWTAYKTGNLIYDDPTTDHTDGKESLPDSNYPRDWELDLTTGVKNGNGVAQNGSGNTPLGVVFRAGSVTVITSDPDVAGYTYKELGVTYSSSVNNLANVFICPFIFNQQQHWQQGQRQYLGKIINTAGGTPVDGGLMFSSKDFSVSPYSGTEVSLVNNNGYIDIARGAIIKSASGGGNSVYTNTDKFVGQPGNFNDFSYGGSLVGNIQAGIPSQMGDPRTNNEQLSIYISGSGADASHYAAATMAAPHTFGTPPTAATFKPDQAGAQGWSDYFAMPASAANCDATNAPAVIADGPLTSIGQLGDLYDPARIQGSGGITYSRGGGRTMKIGQHDDRYSVDPSGNTAPNNTADNIPASNGWASWRLADVFSIDADQEKPGRFNLNGVRRDNGVALMALLDGWKFQPQTKPGATTGSTEWTLHGDGHASTGSMAEAPLDTGATSDHGAAQLVKAIANRLNISNSVGTTIPSGPFFERGEFGELATPSTGSGSPLFGTNPANAFAPTNTALVENVDINKTFDHSREEMFRRLAELICTRGDTFTVYVVGQSIFQAPITNTSQPPPMKVTGTHRMRVTFRLVPKFASGDVPPAFSDASPISAQVQKRFVKADHYAAQVLEINSL